MSWVLRLLTLEPNLATDRGFLTPFSVSIVCYIMACRTPWKPSHIVGFIYYKGYYKEYEWISRWRGVRGLGVPSAGASFPMELGIYYSADTRMCSPALTSSTPHHIGFLWSFHYVGMIDEIIGYWWSNSVSSPWMSGLGLVVSTL